MLHMYVATIRNFDFFFKFLGSSTSVIVGTVGGVAAVAVAVAAGGCVCVMVYKCKKNKKESGFICSYIYMFANVYIDIK